MATGNIGNDVIQTFGIAAQSIRNKHPPMRDNVVGSGKGLHDLSEDDPRFV